MARPASPLDIGGSAQRYTSSSPKNQTSNLTWAIQEATSSGGFQPGLVNTSNPTTIDSGRLSVGGHRDSISNGARSIFGESVGVGARPIQMKERARRESNTGSFVNQMSWGGMSMRSWIGDDMVMAGTSPAMGQSPSFHSSSYLPKMEANFMKDFTCCGLVLDSLHELLQHFEEAHAQTSPQAGKPQRATSFGDPSRSNGASTIPNVPPQVNPEAFKLNNFNKPAQNMSSYSNIPRRGSEAFNRTNLSTVQDVDSLEDMEMDDAGPLPAIEEQQPTQFNGQSQQQFVKQESRVPQLNINTANAFGNQGMRGSNPNTPLATNQNFGLQNNPTVSSVNTPTLGTAPSLQTQRTPDSSMPGTPAELDANFDMGFLSGLPMNMQNMQMMGGNGMDFNAMTFGHGNNNLDGTIDQPAKRLLSKTGAPMGITQQQLALALKSGQLSGDSEMAKKIREQAVANGVFAFQEENKPFRCPVIGCEKAYKNQNGLKYHKQHGHQNQQLKQNDDGTFSIVDPTTSIPYPGTIGMEKEKPYRCEVCGKRYKNLNGLKYHRLHSVQCSPEFLKNLAGINLQGMGSNANVAGAGMSGMGDQFMQQ